MAQIKLAFVKSFIDARGKRRHVFRRKGCRQISIKGRPGSSEYMDQYAELLAQSEDASAHIGASRIRAGTIDALILAYLQSDTFKGLATLTQATRRRILDRFRDFKTPGGRRYGENRIATMIKSDIEAALKDKTPTAQGDWLKTLRPLMTFAIAQGERKTDPTAGIATTRPPKSDGHMTWTEVQIERYRERHAIGSMARLALELALNIAARRHDVRLIGRQHFKNGCLSWRPSKTSRTTAKVLTIRVLPELQAALDAMPRTDALTFMLTEHGRPFNSAAAFGNRFADWCKAAGFKPVLCDDGRVRNYRIHGLRKRACVAMAHASCSALEIMAVSGHASLSEAQKYVSAVEQDRMAETAMAKVAGIKTSTGSV